MGLIGGDKKIAWAPESLVLEGTQQVFLLLADFTDKISILQIPLKLEIWSKVSLSHIPAAFGDGESTRETIDLRCSPGYLLYALHYIASGGNWSRYLL